MPRSLRGRLTLWLVGSTALSLAVFAVVAYVVARYREAADEPDEPAAEQQREVVAQVVEAMAFAAPIGLALAAGGAFWLTRRALRPVDDVIAAAAGMSAERLDARLPEPHQAGELRDLVVALNQLLERLERGHAGLARFSADASHELRTPLAVIGNELEVALRRPRSPDEWQAAARTSLDEVRRLGRLVDALLRLARSEAGPAGRGEPVELAALVEQVSAQHAATAARAGVTLRTSSDGGGAASAQVRADPDALAAALANLVGNALRYTPRGGTVELGCARREPGHIAILVDDDGPGVPAAEREAIFEPFARGAAGRSADDPGLGLGLAIARRVATRWGGSLHIETRPGGGARFVLTLPV
jgi:signal transduction histidine kinase